MKILGYITSILLLMVVSALCNGYVVSTLWEWFVAPTFGLALLSMPAAIGLGALLNYITWQNIKEPENGKKRKPGEVIFEGFALVIMRAILTLLVCWVITLFM